jgi:hypothetical protein
MWTVNVENTLEMNTEFYLRELKRRDHLRDLGVDGTIILN